MSVHASPAFIEGYRKESKEARERLIKQFMQGYDLTYEQAREKVDERLRRYVNRMMSELEKVDE